MYPPDCLYQYMYGEHWEYSIMCESTSPWCIIFSLPLYKSRFAYVYECDIYWQSSTAGLFG